MDKTLDNISDGLRKFVDKVGKLSTFFIIPLVFITMWDVICRKLVWIQIWLVENFGRIFESTLLQELEWHFHTALFLMVLGYGFTHNRHVRVDFIRENCPRIQNSFFENVEHMFLDYAPRLAPRGLQMFKLKHPCA